MHGKIKPLKDQSCEYRKTVARHAFSTLDSTCNILSREIGGTKIEVPRLHNKYKI
jgi:hypothetical protein